MKIYHINEKIIQVNYDNNDFKWKNTSNNALVFYVDEIDPTNKDLCIDISNTYNKVDTVGESKYYMYDNAGTWELYIKDGWIERQQPPPEM